MDGIALVQTLSLKWNILGNFRLIDITGDLFEVIAAFNTYKADNKKDKKDYPLYITLTT